MIIMIKTSPVKINSLRYGALTRLIARGRAGGWLIGFEVQVFEPWEACKLKIFPCEERGEYSEKGFRNFRGLGISPNEEAIFGTECLSTEPVNAHLVRD